jgi:gliding motility-associated-like protein
MGKLYYSALLLLGFCFGTYAVCAQGASDSTTFILSSRKVCVGDTIDIPVRTAHFRRVAGFQFAVSWARGQFRFLGVRNSIFPNSEFDFEAPASGTRVNFAWFKADGTSISLTDTTQIFIIRLVALQPGNPATLGFVTNPRDQTAPVVAQFNQAGNNLREFIPPLIGNTITILPVPTVQATTDTITCAQPFVFLDARSSDSLATFVWTGPNGFRTPLARDTAFVPGRYQVIATREICPSTPLNIIIGFDQTQPPVPTLTRDSINCLRPQAQVGFSPVNNLLEYYWITPQNDTLPHPLPPVQVGGTYRLLIVQPRNGCFSTADALIAQDTLKPSLNLRGQGQLDCRNTSILLNASSNTRRLNYTWRSGAATVGQDSFLRVSSAGAYQLTVQNPRNGCTSRKDTTIAADQALPTATLSPANKITCLTPSATLSASVGSARVRSFWLSSRLDTLARSSSTTVRRGGVYTFVAVDTVNGCSVRLSSIVEADTLRPLSVIRVVTPFSCANPSAQLSVDALNGVSYIWTGQGINGANNAAQVQVSSPGLYRVTLSNTQNGCTFSDSLQLGGTTDGPRFVRLSLRQPPCAADGRGSIGVDVVSGGLAPYLFALRDSTFGAQRNFNNLEPGSYRLRVQDAAGCENDTTLVINASLPIEVNITAPQNEIVLGDSLQLSVALDSTGLGSLVWLGPDLAPCNGCMSILVNPTRSAVYQVQVESRNGCKSQAIFNVFVVKNDQVYAPNAFSPNGDSKNDRFFLSGKKDLKILHFRIFDRWGTLVYTASNGMLNDEALGWDGTYSGKIVPPGAFVWMVELEADDQSVLQYSGEVILMK